MLSIYMCQVNHSFGKGVFLPYSAGIIQSYAQSIPEIRDNCKFQGFIYLRKDIGQVIERMRKAPPDVFGASFYIWNHSYTTALARAIKEAFPKCLVVAGGPHIPIKHCREYLKKHHHIDVVAHYEGEETFAEVLLARLHRGYSGSNEEFLDIPGTTVNYRNSEGRESPKRDRTSDLDKLPSPYLSGVFDELVRSDDNSWHPTFESNRGCPYMCLAGDTPVNTVYGMMPIREVAENYSEIGVFAYSREKEKAIVSTARNILRTGRNRKLVRVHFDDETHIDCTPDHKFLTFKIKNQFTGEQERVVCAEDLRSKDRVRAIKLAWGGQKRQTCYVSWRRKDREIRYRMIAAWMMGRDLESGENVHHIDHDHTNDLPENLQVMSSMKEHMACHPEVAERMRTNNPTKHGLSEEWRKKIGIAQKGKSKFGTRSRKTKNLSDQEIEQRSEESRERYRQAALRREAAKSPEERSERARKTAETKRLRGIRIGNPNRDEDTGHFSGNHRVVRVEELPGRHDVYCMEVPETGWFYANNVLVKNCSFCDWGSSIFTRVRKFSLDRLEEEIRWFAENKMDLVYGADANFGIFDRDMQLVEAMARMKRKTGYPNKFRTAYAKNSGDRVYEISRLLHDAGMNKGVTLSFQSLDETTLGVVKRKNIGIEMYRELMKRYTSEGIATYSEIIIGLPGETYESFAQGLDTLIRAGAHSSINVYTCELLPNSEMSEPDYMSKHGIKGVGVPVLTYHATPESDPHQEIYELVVETGTLPKHDWLQCQKISWAVQCFHCLGLTQSIALFFHTRYGVSYREFYERLLVHAEKKSKSLIGRVTEEITDLFIGITSGKAWGVIDQRFGNITWPPEEGGFLKLISEKYRFYEEIFRFLLEWMPEKCLEWTDVLDYQMSVIKSPRAQGEVFECHHNIPEYLGKAYLSEACELREEHGDYELLEVEDHRGNLEEYARECVWYGRKGGSLQYKVKRWLA